jgi:DNA-binding NarL/FixJ family response regulator
MRVGNAASVEGNQGAIEPWNFLRRSGLLVVQFSGDRLHTSVRILLVDDFAPWRQTVTSMLATKRVNGIEAARQIRERVPGSKIIFLSQESSPDIIQEAMNVGASGYVVKTMAGSDLLTALEPVSEQRQFRSLDGNPSEATIQAD